METVYEKIQSRARLIVSRFPTPDFYEDCRDANKLSRTLLERNYQISMLKKLLAEHLDENFGHGLTHSLKVTLDAGALIIIEGRRSGYSEASLERLVFVAQCAGLLHDIKRRQKDHAVKGAEFAAEILKNFDLSKSEVSDICTAIRNHEAFKDKIPIDTPEGELVSDCLYDADKFRWGPDNFTDTVWDMVAAFNPPLAVFIDQYPKGMEGLKKIKHTFRTHTGNRYGPQFIDIGLAVGQELYNVIVMDFAEELHKSSKKLK
jgi:hypothetical protein